MKKSSKDKTTGSNSIIVEREISLMYAWMARAAAVTAINLAGDKSDYPTASNCDHAEAVAAHAERWARRAGGNAMRHISMR